MREALSNLVTNAIDAVQNGGSVQLRAIATSEAGDGGEMVVISVRDDGQGVAPNSLEHIFEPFRRGAADVSRKAEGTGLGLAISRKLMERHGGTLKIQSTVGVGTIARAVFPAERIISRVTAVHASAS